MKRIMIRLAVWCVLFVAVFGSCSSCQAGEWRDANTWVNERPPLDQVLHTGVGFGLGALTKHYLPKHWKPWVRNTIAVAVPVAVAAIKETTDKNFDAKDIAFYGVGAVLSLTIEW